MKNRTRPMALFIYSRSATNCTMRVYSDRRQRMAHMHAAHTTTPSSVIPKIAGTESTAKTTSENSMTTSTSISGVNLPSWTKSELWYVLPHGTRYCASLTTEFSERSSSSSSMKNTWYVEKMRTAAHTRSRGRYSWIAAAPANTMAARRTIAPTIPQKSTRFWAFSDTTLKYLKTR